MSGMRNTGLALCLSCCSLTGLAENIKLVVHEFPPFSYTDLKSGEIQGMLVEKVQEILKRAGDSYSIGIVPNISSTSLARALQAAALNENTCSFGVHRTPERENLYRWIGPLATDAWVLYGRKNTPRTLKSLEDAKPYVIGSFKSAASGIKLAELGYKLEFANNDEDNLRLLVNGRIDYWNSSELHGLAVAQQQGHANDISRALRYKDIELYMVCNLNMDKQKIIVFNKFNKEIDSDGSMEKLFNKYGVR